jgi:hypothetical protein
MTVLMQYSADPRIPSPLQLRHPSRSLCGCDLCKYASVRSTTKTGMQMQKEERPKLTAVLHNPHPDPHPPFIPNIHQQSVLPSNALLSSILPKHLSTNHLRLVERDVHIALRMDDLQHSHLPRRTFAVINQLSKLQKVRRSRCRSRVSREPLSGRPLVYHVTREGSSEPWEGT